VAEITRAIISVLDGWLAAIDLEGCAGDGRVRHEVDGERRDVGRAQIPRIGSVVSSCSRRASSRSPSVAADLGVSVVVSVVKVGNVRM
jgi:hypothetical protein